MYTIDDLNVRLLSELKEMAEGFGIKTNKLSKQDLIYKILDHQAANPPAKKPAPAAKGDKQEKGEAEGESRLMI
jgi:transcription termination factor Rho